MKRIVLFVTTLFAFLQMATAQREVVSLDGEWQFTDPDSVASTTVQVPDSWQSTGMSGYRMPKIKTCTYERTVNVSPYADKRLLLGFEGVNKTAVVKIDDVEVGRHTGGYTSFYIDITDAAKGKSEVKLTVDVKNADYSTLPLSADFAQYGGIYRDVNLVAVNPQVSFSNMDDGSNGVYLNYTMSNGNVSLSPTIVLDSKESGKATVVTIIKDASGKVVNTSKQDVAVDGTATQKVTLRETIQLKGVHKWNGVNDPYLYTAVVKVKYNGEEVDKVTQKIGFRTFKIKEGKFYLNGKQYAVHGIGMHQDQGATTSVSTPEQREADISAVLEMGANAVRTSHYPHNQHIYNLCDEKGLIVWCEIPFSTVMIETDSFKNNGVQLVREMVKQNVNHPSIFIWGIGNEVGQEVALEHYSEASTLDQINDYLNVLGSTAKGIDPSRLVGMAQLSGTDKVKKTGEGLGKTGTVNVIGFNLYTGWYSQVDGATEANKVKSIVKGLKKVASSYTSVLNEASDNELSYVITEYGAGANIEQHCELGEDFAWAAKNGTEGYKTTGDFHPEEYQSYVHEAMYMAINGDFVRQIAPVSGIWASFPWCMFDFSCYRNEGGVKHLNTKGLITADRQTKKDAFYLYKANWNKTDYFTHICSSRYIERNDTVAVKVYSNCEAVKLTVNGRNLGSGTKIQDGVFKWEKVVLKENNTVVARGFNRSTEVCSDECDAWTTTGVIDIEAPAAGNADASTYNLAGMRVNRNAAGIVIKGGKKYVE